MTPILLERDFLISEGERREVNCFDQQDEGIKNRQALDISDNVVGGEIREVQDFQKQEEASEENYNINFMQNEPE